MDKASVIERLEKEWETYDLSMVPEAFKDDPDVVLAACCVEGTAMRFASDRLRNSRDFAFTLASNHLGGLEFMSSNIRDDKEVVLRMLNIPGLGHDLEYVSDRLKKDPEVLQTALRNLDIPVESFLRSEAYILLEPLIYL